MQQMKTYLSQEICNSFRCAQMQSVTDKYSRHTTASCAIDAIHSLFTKFESSKLHSILHNPGTKRCLKAISLNVVCFTFSLFLFQCLITTISFYLQMFQSFFFSFTLM